MRIGILLYRGADVVQGRAAALVDWYWGEKRKGMGMRRVSKFSGDELAGGAN
jgi:hypothetical protein